MRVLVLGHSGMLGHTVARYLGQCGLSVVTLEDRLDPDNPAKYLKTIRARRPSWCVNALGTKEGPRALFINGHFPGLLSSEMPNMGLVHASSDGVFAAEAGKCELATRPSACDPYGRAKVLAEQGVSGAQHHIIRCSIVGRELRSRKHLLEWYVSNSRTVTGYHNQLWNGLSTLHWAVLCRSIIAGEIRNKLIQPGFLPAISKYDLLIAIKKVFGGPAIHKGKARIGCTRFLEPSVEVPRIDQQLREYKEWLER